MLLIACPNCGPRAGAEFVFERPVEAIVPLDAAREAATARLYTRENPSGRSPELWRHAYGCRDWLRVERDTLTHEILGVTLWRERP